MGANQSAEKSAKANHNKGGLTFTVHNRHRQDEVERSPRQLLPIEKLARRLEEITAKEESQRGISPRVFQTRVFPAYPELAERLLRSLRRTGGSTVAPLTADELVEGAEKLMTILSDERQTEMYLRMYAEGEADLSKTAFQQLVALAHAVALDHYPDGPRCCRKTDHTLHALANAAFHGKESLSVGYLTHWIAENCPRLLLGLHRYVVHHLNTSYRTLDSPLGTLPQNEEEMDLGTPVLENKGFAFATSAAEEREAGALPLSQVWLLAVSLPKVYTQPSVIHSPSAGSGLASLDSQGIIARWLGSVCPSHWTPLYNSDVHGLGANRFLNHVLNYRGPTLTLVRGEGGVEFCVGATDEWRETHLYWGAQDCIVLQTQPLFHVIERGAKLVYLNTSIRGYPLGVRAGCDPRKPSLSVNEAFTQLEYKGIPYPLLSVEVWGCGTSHSREAQLELKKWQVKQAERQRQVKLSAADWVDHPDRYLLELGGRTTYNDP